jgi:hypothetical protein
MNLKKHKPCSSNLKTLLQINLTGALPSFRPNVTNLLAAAQPPPPLRGQHHRCGCAFVDPRPGGTCCRTECGVQHSTLDHVGSCPVPNPTRWPALAQVPPPEYRAVRTPSQPFDGLPDPSCRGTGSCPAAVLVTSGNRSLAQSTFSFCFASW